MANTAEFMLRKLTAFCTDRQGATAIEYGLIIAIISCSVIVGMESIRDNFVAILHILSDTFANAMA